MSTTSQSAFDTLHAEIIAGLLRGDRGRELQAMAQVRVAEAWNHGGHMNSAELIAKIMRDGRKYTLRTMLDVWDSLSDAQIAEMLHELAAGS